MIKKTLVTLFSALTLTLAGGFAGTSLLYAADVGGTGSLCSGAEIDLGGGSDCESNSEGGLNDLIASVINIFSVIVGIVAVIMIIVGGFRFVTSGGDSGKVGSAKSAVVYALVGLIVVALAQVIVRFVLGKIG